MHLQAAPWEALAKNVVDVVVAVGFEPAIICKGADVLPLSHHNPPHVLIH